MRRLAAQHQHIGAGHAFAERQRGLTHNHARRLVIIHCHRHRQRRHCTIVVVCSRYGMRELYALVVRVSIRNTCHHHRPGRVPVARGKGQRGCWTHRYTGTRRHHYRNRHLSTRSGIQYHRIVDGSAFGNFQCGRTHCHAHCLVISHIHGDILYHHTHIGRTTAGQRMRQSGGLVVRISIFRTHHHHGLSRVPVSTGKNQR